MSASQNSKSSDCSGKSSLSSSLASSGTTIGKRFKSSHKKAGCSRKLVDDSPTSPPSEEKKKGRILKTSALNLSESSEGKVESPECIDAVQILFEGSGVAEFIAVHNRPLDPELIIIGNKVKDLMGINNQGAQLSMAAEVYKKFPSDKPNAIPVQVSDIYGQATLIPGAQSEFGQAEFKAFEARASRYLHEGAQIEHSLNVSRIDNRFMVIRQKVDQVSQVHDLYRAVFDKH